MSEKPVSEMKKDELAEFAREKLCMELDLSRPIKDLRLEVAALVASPPAAEAPEVEKPNQKDKPMKGFLKHPTNGRVYPATAHLLSRKDMVPCDKNGKPVLVEEEA